MHLVEDMNPACFSFQQCLFRWCLSKLGMFPWQKGNTFRQVVKKVGMKEDSKIQGEFLLLHLVFISKNA